MTDLGLVDLPELIGKLIPRIRLDKYYNLLMEENRRVNLVSRETTRADFDRMVGESVLPLAQLVAPVRDYLDIGSGGGIPAIPFLLAGAVAGRAVLVERTKKKARALSTILEKLALSADVIPQNFDEIEDLPLFDLVTVRYVKLSETLLAGISRVLRPGGRLIYYGPALVESSDLESRPFTFSSSQDSAAKSLTIFQK